MSASGIPSEISQLPFTTSQVYDLSVTGAGQLNIPIVGSVAGGYNRRVVVLERAAYAKVPVPEGQALYGYALRLAITISKRDANTKLSLPFLAASAEVGLIEARWMLQVVGLAGGELDNVSLNPTELSVETFVLAKQSLANLIGAVHHASTRFLPQQIGLEQSPQQQERRAQQAIGMAFALGCLERRWDLQRAQNALGAASDEARDVLVDAYDKLAGIQSLTDRPSEAVQRKAREMLRRVRVDAR